MHNRAMSLHERIAAVGWPAATRSAIIDRLETLGLSADVVAIGWATVDAERVAGGAELESRPRDPHVGATASILAVPPRLDAATEAATEAATVVLLEPDTEGRLAATLARSGEGPAVLYLEVGADGLESARTAIRRRGGSSSVVLDGPFGRSTLLLGEVPWGPHLILVEAGTIAG